MRLSLSSTLLALVVASLSACSTTPETEAKAASIRQEADATIEEFKARDPSMKQFFETAHGYAIFPSVGKGGVGVGGAYGRGVCYEQGKAIGYCSLSQGSIGFQLGGQAYSEAICFQTKEALNEFKTGNFALAAQASAVAATAGAAAHADYNKGVAVFTMARGGLMFEASVGGQKFDFDPISAGASAK
jgi:lipid-binding SYLF domain-containing protein